MSKSDDDPKPILNEVGEQILTALENVAGSAQSPLGGLARAPTSRPNPALAGIPAEMLYAKLVVSQWEGNHGG
jgi:hypothetical protein